MRGVKAAIAGMGGNMITLDRARREAYGVTTGCAPLERVANVERLFPEEWMPAEPGGPLREFAEWARPLLGEVAPFARLQ